MVDIGGSLLTSVFAILLIAGVGLLGFVGVRALIGGVAPPEGGDPPGGPEGGAGSRTEARRILDERYARGELTTAEYRERIEALGEGR